MSIQSNGGSFSTFYYGSRKKPFISAYRVNPSNYFGTNGAGAVTAGVGVQTVATVNNLRWSW